ncbi:metal ABC transporter permease, partial [Pediococcus acidilactici]
SLAGVALGILLGTSTTWSTILVVTIAAVILEYLQTVYKHYVEISTAILMSLGLAISLIVMSKSENGSSVNLDQYLF